MLIAKYVKVSSRTDTQPFLFTFHVGDKLGVVISGVYPQFAAHWHRSDPVVEVSYE
jgi:hypothetical protein